MLQTRNICNALMLDSLTNPALEKSPANRYALIFDSVLIIRNPGAIPHTPDDSVAIDGPFKPECSSLTLPYPNDTKLPNLFASIKFI